MPTFVIVGASRGLGYAWLQNLSKDPANTVIGTARSTAATEARLAKDGINNVKIVAADMTNAASMATAAAETAKLTNGVVDYLIINGAYISHATAYYPPTAFIGQEELLQKDFIDSLNTNVLGVMYTTNAFLPLVRKSNIKKIVAISTGMADLDLILYSGNAISVPYSATKAALNIVVAKYSQELKPEGIIFLSLSPGLVNTKETPPTPKEIEEYNAMIKEFKKLKPDFERPLEPAESVEAQKKVIENLTMADTGAFLSHWGNKQWL